jgi:ribosomal protein S18 acetylase RimI-like enzyme
LAQSYLKFAIVVILKTANSPNWSRQFAKVSLLWHNTAMIRLATINDVRAVQELCGELFADPTSQSDKYVDNTWPTDERGRKYFEHGVATSTLWVAELDNVLVGYLIAEFPETWEWRPIKRAALDSFYVKPAYRSQGIGKPLTSVFFAWAKSKSADIAIVSVYADNERGKQFYQREGFKPYAIDMEFEL